MKATVIYPESFREPTVFEFPAKLVDECDPKERLNFIYRQLNHVNGEEWISGKKLRSMSVGDIIIFDVDIESKLIFVCCPVGWKELSELVKIPEPWTGKKNDLTLSDEENARL